MFILDLWFDPASLLQLWAAGVAGAGALVAHWRIVGPGFLWLTSGAVVLLGGAAWFLGPDLSLFPIVFGFMVGPDVPKPWLFLIHPSSMLFLGCLAAVAGAAARRPRPAAVLLTSSGALFFLGSYDLRPTGAAALGGITGAMLLGHWYLVSPRPLRRAMRILTLAGGIGVALDVLLIYLFTPFSEHTGTVALLLALGGMSLFFLEGMWFSLRQPAHSGVRTATGLSYLAVLTSLGAVTIGRLLTPW